MNGIGHLLLIILSFVTTFALVFLFVDYLWIVVDYFWVDSGNIDTVLKVIISVTLILLTVIVFGRAMAEEELEWGRLANGTSAGGYDKKRLSILSKLLLPFVMPVLFTFIMVGLFYESLVSGFIEWIHKFKK